MGTLIAYLPLLAQGALVTLALAVLSLVVATALGGLGAALRVRRGAIGRWVVTAYTTIVRGIPDLVLLLLVYFGGQRLSTPSSPAWASRRSRSRSSGPASSRSASSTAPI
jgi:His/Glu/Gln/Arg/opine family amino acid ABC transporter permease subunit